MPQSSPKPSAWGAIAIEASKGTPIWSITETDFTYISSTKKIQPSIRSGAATKCSLGQITLFCWGAAGVATTGTTTTGAYSGGIIWLHPVKTGSNIDMIFAGRALKTAATGPQFIISVGFGGGVAK